jgi:Ca-activated chloride channel family protein
LLALAAVFVAGLGLAAAQRRRKDVAKVISSHHLETLTHGLSVRRPFLQSSLYGMGLLLFSLALAQPQCAGKTEWVKRSGIDVVVALDASKSMYAEDVLPSRMQRARVELNSLLDALKGDRVAIVAFAADAFVQCPMTHDYAAARLFLNAVEPASMPQGGTHIGAALSLAKQLFEHADNGTKTRVVVLLSDGEDLTGDVDEAVEALAEAGIRVFAVGIGSEEGEPIPLFDEAGRRIGFQKDGAGNTVISRLEREGLRAIAEKTDGRYFHTPRGVATVEVARAIDELEKSDFKSRLTVRYAEGFQYFVGSGLLAISLAMVLSPSRRRAA